MVSFSELLLPPSNPSSPHLGLISPLRLRERLQSAFDFFSNFFFSLLKERASLARPKNPIFTSKTEMGTHIPDDLVIQILSRLPITSLFRFRCVSKHWTNLVSHVLSSQWHTLFFYRAAAALRAYAPIGPKSQHFQDGFESLLSRLPFYPAFQVIDSCNGLLLLSQTRGLNNPSLYFVWYPATMQFTALPYLPDNNCSSYSQMASYVAFDPHESTHYRVFQFTFNKAHTYIIVEMYSSMTRKWSMSTANPFPSKSLLFSCMQPISVYHKEAFHMVSWNNELLVRFDIKKGSFHSIMLPGKKPDTLRGALIGKSRGHLYYAVSTHSPQFELCIYRLDKHQTSKWFPTMFKKEDDMWVLAHKTSLGDIIPPAKFQPVAFHPDSEVIYLSREGKILAYSPSSGSLEEIYEVTDTDYILRWKEIFPVIPCL